MLRQLLCDKKRQGTSGAARYKRNILLALANVTWTQSTVASWIEIVHPVQCLIWCWVEPQQSDTDLLWTNGTRKQHTHCMRYVFSVFTRTAWGMSLVFSARWLRSYGVAILAEVISCCYTKPSFFPRWLSSAASLVLWSPWRCFFGDWNHFSRLTRRHFPRRQIGELSLSGLRSCG